MEATLKAALSRLVERDQDMLLQHGATTSSPGAVKGLVLIAELGLAPSQLPLNILAEEPTPAVDDPWAWCERLADTASASLGVTIHVASASLRRLTTGPQPLAAALFTMPPNPHDRGVFDALFVQYGVQAPTLSFDLSNAAEDVVVFRFGGVSAPPARLLPNGVEAIEPTRAIPHDADVLGYTVDPVYGGLWPLVTTATAERLSKSGSSGRYGAARFLLRALLAEIQCRLGWYPPRGWVRPWWVWTWPWREPVAAALDEQRAAVFRWLLADRATVHHADPISEGVARGLASGRRLVPDLVAEARLALQGAVLGPVLVDTAVTTIVAAPNEIDKCLDASSPWPLLDRYPGLRLDPRTQILVVSAAVRSRVQQLMRPLADTVLVAAAEELSRIALQPPRDLVDEAGREIAGEA